MTFATSSLIRQLVPLVTGRIGASVVSAVWFAVMVRQLPVVAVGNIILLLSINSVVFVAVADAGLTMALATHVARYHELARSSLKLVAARRLLLGGLAAALTGSIYLLLADRADPMIPIIFSISVLSTAFYSSVTAVMRAVGHAGVDGGNDFLSRMFVLGAGWWWLSHGGGLRSAVVVYVVADLASAVGCLCVVSRWLPRSDRRLPSTRLSLRQAGPLAIATAATVAFTRIDVWILAFFTNGSTVAVYAAAYRLLDGLLLGATAVAALVIPSVASRSKDGGQVAARLARLALALTLLPCLGVALFARPILGAVFGNAYRGGSSVLVILTLAAVPASLTLCYAQAMAARSSKTLASITVTVLMVNLVVDAGFIAVGGALGAAWATLVVQVLFLSLLVRAGRRVDAGQESSRRIPVPTPGRALATDW